VDRHAAHPGRAQGEGGRRRQQAGVEGRVGAPDPVEQRLALGQRGAAGRAHADEDAVLAGLASAHVVAHGDQIGGGDGLGADAVDARDQRGATVTEGRRDVGEQRRRLAQGVLGALEHRDDLGAA
jgi:hypothetical protein